MTAAKRLAAFFLSSFVIPILLVLSACSAGGENPTPDPEPEPGVTTLIYAQISEDGVDREWLERFNREHEGEVQIEVRDYSQTSEGGQQGMDLLMTEIAAGKVPDIIELGTSGETTELPYRKLAEQGFLEDLWPYIENDMGLGRVGVIEAPLKAAEVDGGLYTVFEGFRLHTLTGAKAVVGDRTGWTVEDLLEAFETMPEGSVILETYEDYSVQQHLLASFLYGFSDLFIDLESRQCYFDGELFRAILDLVKRVPDECWWHPFYASQEDRKYEYHDRQMDGLVMLDDTSFWRFFSIRDANLYFGEATCIGYPVGDGSSGVYLEPSGIKLAMSSTCADKDAAWQYIRWLITPKLKEYAWGFPVNKKLHNRERGWVIRAQHRIKLSDGRQVYDDPVTREQLEYVTSLFDTNRSSILLDKEVRDIVLDTAGAYFAGDRDLEQTVQMLNSRVGLYLNEQM